MKEKKYNNCIFYIWSWKEWKEKKSVLNKKYKVNDLLLNDFRLIASFDKWEIGKPIKRIEGLLETFSKKQGWGGKFEVIYKLGKYKENFYIGEYYIFMRRKRDEKQ